MASIFTKEEKPTVQTGLELTESLHESKKCVIKRVPWTEMITTYGDGCKQILGIGADTFLCISRIEDEVAASGKQLDIEIYRFEGRSMHDKPLARITKTSKKGEIEFRGSNGNRIGFLDGLAIHRKAMPEPAFFVGGIDDFKEVKRKWDKHNAPKAEDTDESKKSGDPKAENTDESKKSSEPKKEDTDKPKKEDTDGKKKSSGGFFATLCCCFGGGDEIKNPGKITENTKDFRIVKLPNYAQQLDGHRRADSIQLELTQDVESTQDALLLVLVMVSIDFLWFVAPSLEVDKGKN